MSFAFVDLFAGCGGLSLGLMQAGARCVLAVEKMEDAFQTLDANLSSPVGLQALDWPSGIPRGPHDIKQLISTHEVALRKLGKEVDVLVGGPPCQGFSLYGRRRPNDGRNRLYGEYLKFVELVQPRAVLLENVEGIDMPFVQQRAGTGLQCRNTAAWRIRERLFSLGYDCHVLRLCASDYGVPQYRSRFFIVGLRGTSTIDEQELLGLREELRADHLESLGLSRRKKVSTIDAISDLETADRGLVACDDSVGFEQVRYRGPRTAYQRSMHEGMPRLESPNSTRLARHRLSTVEKFVAIQQLGVRGFHAGLAAQRVLESAKHRVHWLAPNTPAPTITTLPDDFIHYSEPRILTLRECARLQSFPDWFRFLGKYTSGGDRRSRECPRFTQVGNAVPPRMAQFLGHYLVEVLDLLRRQRPMRIAA